jgi:DNA polymerase-2
MTLWLMEPSQKLHRLTDASFRPCFYVQGRSAQLQRLRRALSTVFSISSCFTERRSLWDGRTIPVLEVAVEPPTLFPHAGRFARRFDPNLRLYNSDLMLAALYCWEKGVFPFARVEADATETGGLRALACCDDEWAADYELPPLRILQVRLSGLSRVNPAHGRTGALEVEVDGQWRTLDDSDTPAAETFARLLRHHDPDLILGEWSDSLLLPQLLEQARRLQVDLRLNRDARPVQQSRARSLMSYGRILFKNRATTLFGRLHVDTSNSFIADKCELDGLWELVRVTKLPVQYAARTSTGTGISYMQMELAYRDGVLIPEQKAEPEDPKHPDELLRADRGGLILPPRLGFHENVAELDFVSEYPSIMARFNISPETVNCRCCPDAPAVPELGYRVCRRRRGLTSRVVERLIAKRADYKQRQRTAPEGLARSYKLRRDAHKWLLVCCFGYTGYKNARFGKIEAHEAINAVARETLLVAMETAERRGFRLLHALVDSLYVQKEAATRRDYERLAEEIEQRTGLPMALEALYRYAVFLPSKQCEEIPVPNRFFAVAEDGTVKIRGLECRRHDTPPLLARLQREALAILAEAWDGESYCRKLEEARRLLERERTRLEEGAVSLEELVISKCLTRLPQTYQKPCHTAIAAQQLAGRGVRLRPGEAVHYVITDARAALPNDRVRAYALWEGWMGYDREKYRELLLAAFRPFEHYAPPHHPAILALRGES